MRRPSRTSASALSTAVGAMAGLEGVARVEFAGGGVDLDFAGRDDGGDGEAALARDGDGDEAVSGEGEDGVERFLVCLKPGVALGGSQHLAGGGGDGVAGGTGRGVDVNDL
eukprot:scaffold267012_cov28-Tisochrysis_lutea.AAC.1